MAEYIEREAIKYEQWAVGPLNGPLMVVRKKTIDSIPAADVVEVVHGRWISTEEKPHLIYRCSECGGKWSYGAMLHCKYCPNCGARMDGE